MSRSSGKLGRSMVVVSGGILLSRVLGLFRDVAFASQWGTGTAFAAFVIAFTIPNLLRALFGEGAFSAAFVPVFSHSLEENGRRVAWQVANRVITVLVLLNIQTAINRNFSFYDFGSESGRSFHGMVFADTKVWLSSASLAV